MAAQDEKRRVYDHAFRDRELSETVSTVESSLLDVDQGEILQESLRYQRRFDVLDRR
jgi:hypothetical protein